MEEQEVELSETGKRAKELLDILDNPLDNASLIQDNKIIFVLENYVYRCRMPNQKERTLALDKRDELKTQLLLKGTFLTKNQIKKLLKEKQNIDIDLLEQEKEKDINVLKNLYLELAILPSSQEEKIEKIKNQIQEAKLIYTKKIYEITEYLSGSIEDKLDKEYIEYLTYLCTEKNIKDDVWGKIWDSYDDYQTKNTKLEIKSVEYMANLLIHSRD